MFDNKVFRSKYLITNADRGIVLLEACEPDVAVVLL